MNDQIRVLDELEEKFARAIAATPTTGRRRRPWLYRLPRRHQFLAGVAVVVLASTSAALAAVGVFQTGTPLEPTAPPVAAQGNGVAVAQTSAVLTEAADPGGSLPWGLRVVKTTRGESCVQVGRVQGATIGILGQDGAFANDGEFHPLSANYHDPLSCAAADINGAAFLNVVRDNAPASGLDGGCRLADQPQPRLPAAQQPSTPTTTALCSTSDLREIYYGLLGPDAVSVTYHTTTGQTATTTTAGPDGAYLIVLPYVPGGQTCGPQQPVCPTDSMGTADGLWADGVIQSIQYRDGQTCARNLNLPLGQQPTCPQLGAAPAQPTPPAATVTSPITVHVDGPTTVTVSFPSPVAITTSSSYYYFSFNNPTTQAGSMDSACSNPNASSDFITDTDYQPGQTVSDTQTLPACAGMIHGTVMLVTSGDARDHLPGVIGQNAVTVGNFSFALP